MHCPYHPNELQFYRDRHEGTGKYNRCGTRSYGRGTSVSDEILRHRYRAGYQNFNPRSREGSDMVFDDCVKPHELYAAQGFPSDYIIDRDISGRKITKTEQVKRCGNAVCPPIPAALVKANLPELCKTKRNPICRPDRVQQENGGQLRFA